MVGRFLVGGRAPGAPALTIVFQGRVLEDRKVVYDLGERGPGLSLQPALGESRIHLSAAMWALWPSPSGDMAVVSERWMDSHSRAY